MSIELKIYIIVRAKFWAWRMLEEGISEIDYDLLFFTIEVRCVFEFCPRQIFVWRKEKKRERFFKVIPWVCWHPVYKRTNRRRLVGEQCEVVRLLPSDPWIPTWHWPASWWISTVTWGPVPRGTNEAADYALRSMYFGWGIENRLAESSARFLRYHWTSLLDFWISFGKQIIIR